MQFTDLELSASNRPQKGSSSFSKRKAGIRLILLAHRTRESVELVSSGA